MECLLAACLRGNTVMETKASLKVVRTGVKRVLIYSETENATPSALPWTLFANFTSKTIIFCSYVPAAASSTASDRVPP